MGEFVEITEPSDPRVRDYVALRDTSLRRSLESEFGLFIAEGEKIVRRAVEAGYHPRSFLLAKRWIPGLREVIENSDAPVYVVSEALAEQITGFHVHRGALASMHRTRDLQMRELLGAERLVVCEDIVDHTNMGAIIRSAAGLGWDGVLLAPRAADPLYRRAIKTSMGAVFALPWTRMDNWADGIAELKRAGFACVAMALEDDAVPLHQFAAKVRENPKRIALMVGTEGGGLSRYWLDQADTVVTIPMSKGIDSLNVAVATAIACYELGPEDRAV